jgi:DNA-binding transcriptional regulator YdaS (Cro superfamily)
MFALEMETHTTNDTRIAQWLREQDKTQAWFANKLGISVATMSRIVRGETVPRTTTVLRIEKLTGGQVTASDLAQARSTNTPANKAGRIRRAKNLIQRGQSMLAAAAEER